MHAIFFLPRTHVFTWIKCGLIKHLFNVGKKSKGSILDSVYILAKQIYIKLYIKNPCVINNPKRIVGDTVEKQNPRFAIQNVLESVLVNGIKQVDSLTVINRFILLFEYPMLTILCII